jgi:DNA-binding Xre family transcriptional regulator
MYVITIVPLRNRIKQFVDDMGITPYQFRKDTGLAANTAYNLYNDPDYIPGAAAMTKICQTYKVQPGVLIEYIQE